MSEWAVTPLGNDVECVLVLKCAEDEGDVRMAKDEKFVTLGHGGSVDLVEGLVKRLLQHLRS